uniref:Ty3 transposon capsid-like protein domain-containing protein n=1 Tax=Chenopodium quinoa TaxID=63459 RepID=A0A803N1K7_CHEQI
MTDSVGKVENEVITLKGQLGELDNRLEEVSLDAQSLADQAFEKMMGEMAKMREEFTGELLALKKENELLKEELTLLKRTTVAGGATIQAGPKVEIPKPPKYHGKRDAREIDNFLWSMERYFEAVHLEEDASKINVVTMYLGDDAILWWRRREQDIKSGSCSIRTWDQFKEDFKKQFRPHDAAKVSMMKLRELKHSSTIKEYIKQFTTLVLEVDNLPEAAQLIYFIGGLQRWAQQEVERRNVQTLAEAIAAAESLVDYRDTRKEGRSKGKGGGAKPTDRSSTSSNKTVKKDKAKGSSSSSSSSEKPNNRGCYLCGGPHWARDCPGRQKLSAIIASGGESSGDDAQTGSLRLFSSVRATPKAEESTKVVQVSTLPRPKGSLMFVDTLVNGRASKALVDCGASHNFITEKEAMKLGIKYTKEPGRIKTVNTSPVPILGVAHKVPICLGQWSGTINLTVVHMDDFSLVLGLEFIDTVRPFSFEADGSIMIKRDQGSWSVLVTREEVEAKTISAIQVSRGIKKGQETFLAALVEEEEPHGNEVPSEISGVLEEYKDVMPPELPKRLPPRREKKPSKEEALPQLRSHGLMFGAWVVAIRDTPYVLQYFSRKRRLLWIFDSTPPKLRLAVRGIILFETIQTLTDFTFILTRAYVSGEDGCFMDVFHVMDVYVQKIQVLSSVSGLRVAETKLNEGGKEEKIERKTISEKFSITLLKCFWSSEPYNKYLLIIWWLQISLNMGDIQNAPLSEEETTCRFLLYELQDMESEEGGDGVNYSGNFVTDTFFPTFDDAVTWADGAKVTKMFGNKTVGVSFRAGRWFKIVNATTQAEYDRALAAMQLR